MFVPGMDEMALLACWMGRVFTCNLFCISITLEKGFLRVLARGVCKLSVQWIYSCFAKVGNIYFLKSLKTKLSSLHFHLSLALSFLIRVFGALLFISRSPLLTFYSGSRVPTLGFRDRPSPNTHDP